MRILFLSWNAPPTLGGIEYVVGNLFEGLRAQGHEIDLVTSWSDAADSEPGIHRAGVRGLSGFLRFAWSKGGRLGRRGEVDVIVCGSVVAALPAWLLSIRFGCPFVVLVHGSDLLYPRWAYQRVVRFLYRRADRMTANSSATRDLLQQAGIDQSKIDVIYPGVRVQDFEHEPDHGAEVWLARLGQRPLMLTVGRLIRRKGVLEFVRHVMPRLIREAPEIVFIVVGADATRSLVHGERLRDRIEQAVREQGLQEHVWLAGSLPDADLIRLFFRSTLFVMPCLDLPGDVEGFGIVYLEAALAGSPCVGTRVGGIPDAVVDGETGLLAEPGDHAGIAERILQLLQDSALRKRLAAAGARRAREEFSWAATTRRYEAAFQRCIEGSG